MNRVSAKQIHEMLLLNSSLLSKTAVNKQAMLLMLMNLMEHEKDGMAVTSLCYGSCVTITTALRYIDILEKQGLIKRSHDDGDHRRKIVTLTKDGFSLVTDYISDISGIFAPN